MLFLFVLYGVISLLIGLSDFLFYRIPNVLVATFAGILLMQGLIFWNPVLLASAVVLLVSFLVLGAVFFRLGLMGAGDVKYFSVTAAWSLMLHELVFFLLCVTISGAILGVIYLLYGPVLEVWRQKTVACMQRLSLNSFCKPFTSHFSPLVHERIKGRKVMPYGVAISFGCVILIIIKLMHHEL